MVLCEAEAHCRFMNLHAGKMKTRRGWQGVHDDAEVGPHRLAFAAELCGNRLILQENTHQDAGQQHRGYAMIDPLLFKQEEPTINLTPKIYRSFENQMQGKPEGYFCTMR